MEEGAVTDLERFMSKTRRDPESGCLLWTAARFRAGGYGAFGVGEIVWRAHRWIFREKFGYLPEVVMHRCDTPACVDWERCLMPGTHKSNAEDREAKGRGNKGERNGMVKLTDQEVSDIRLEYPNGVLSMAMLGEAYGVSAGHICEIIHRKRRQ